MSLIVFHTSSTNNIPKYHPVFYPITGCAAIYVMYVTSDFLTKIMELVSIVTKLSSTFIGCTFLAFGNCLGPMLSNIGFAREGYEKMALGACFGQPIFSKISSILASSHDQHLYFAALGLATGVMLIGRCLIRTGGLQRYEITSGTIGKNCIMFMMLGLSGLVMGMVFTNFIARRSLGIFLLIVYGMCVISLILSEAGIVHPFGTDHQC